MSAHLATAIPVINATSPDEFMIKCTATTIVEKARHAPDGPAVILIGATMEMCPPPISPRTDCAVAAV
jgi:siroheme synthase